MERFCKNSYLAHVLAQARKIKKIHPEKNSLYFGKKIFLALKLKNFLILFYIFGNVTFSAQARKNKKKPPQGNFLYFGKMELSNSNIKKFLISSQKKAFLIFRKRKPRKNSLYFLKRKLFVKVSLIPISS